MSRIVLIGFSLLILNRIPHIKSEPLEHSQGGSNMGNAETEKYESDYSSMTSDYEFPESIFDGIPLSFSSEYADSEMQGALSVSSFSGPVFFGSGTSDAEFPESFFSGIPTSIEISNNNSADKALDSELPDISFSGSGTSDSDFPDSYFSGIPTSIDISDQTTKDEVRAPQISASIPGKNYSLLVGFDSNLGGKTSDSEFTSSVFSELPTSIHSFIENFESQQPDSVSLMSDSRGSIEYFLDKIKNMPTSKLYKITKKFSKIIRNGVPSGTAIPDDILSIVHPSIENALEKVLNNPESMVTSVENNFLQMMDAPGLIDEDVPKIKSGFKNAFKAPELSLGDISAIQEGVLEVLNVPDKEIPSVLRSVAEDLIEISQSGDSRPPSPQPFPLGGLLPIPRLGTPPVPPLGRPSFSYLGGQLSKLKGFARKLFASIQNMEEDLLPPGKLMI